MILAAYTQTGSIRKAASQLGVARQTVQRVLRTLGIEPIRRNSGYTDSERDAMVAEYRRTGSVALAAKEIGCSSATIADVLARAGIERNGRSHPGKPPTWRRVVRTNGYVYLYGCALNRGFSILEHRLIVERALGRPLRRDETVHHRNGVKTDNRLENLELWQGTHPVGRSHCPHCGCWLGSVVMQAVREDGCNGNR